MKLAECFEYINATIESRFLSKKKQTFVFGLALRHPINVLGSKASETLGKVTFGTCRIEQNASDKQTHMDCVAQNIIYVHL